MPVASRKPLALFSLLVCIDTITHAQSFEDVHAFGRISHFLHARSPNRNEGTGTKASLTHDPNFKFVFVEHLGDIYRGTFYFTRASMGKPLVGYYIRCGSTRKIPVRFLGGAHAQP
jgi:hypothetical protein